MPNQVYDNQYNHSTEDEIEAVSVLMYQCGVSVDMHYTPDGSGSNGQSAKSALINYFKYSEEMNFIKRSSYSDDKWIKILKAEIYDNRPMYYQANASDGSGHAFVCDGYESTKQGYYLHFNWGWSGQDDGFYSIDGMTEDLNFDHSIIINLAPPGKVPVFTADIQKGVAPLTVQFTDQSEGSPTGWEWDFDMDGIIDSYEQNPTWTYNDDGDYTVCLKVNYDSESYQKTKVEYIDVQSENELYGTVSNDRTLSGIVNVSADTKISTGTTLTIMPGTKIQFNGNYLLTIDGNIKAIGTVDDTISFTADNNMKFNNLGWEGISFSGKANDTTEFAYCSFDYVRKGTVIKSINNQNLKITNCKFSNNTGNILGVWFHNKSKLIIDKCLFENNSNHEDGLFASWATIFSGYYADGSITNSIIRNNSMSQKGSLLISNSSDIDLLNNTIIDNYYTEDTPSVITVSTTSNLDLVNTILWNEGFDEINFEGSNTTSILNCNIQNGVKNINGDSPEFLAYSGNINVDPQFKSNSFELESWSQNIDRGVNLPDSLYLNNLDYYGNIRTAGTIMDIGAIEFQDNKETFNVGFQTNILSGEFPLSVTFTDTTKTDNIISLKWDFENDGEWDVSDSVEVAHVYDRPGVFFSQYACNYC